ncbi:type IX secretion system membrane protein PorP/SprF [Aureibaculum sp. A20]|uniref:Type IX secretion system membrane protein PorP/SprF n=1 Tax=Aureibaculum flavum TaxID=2795986 RepID=A0ABS0WWQ6_9FLAO|nr:type IX secretion system membrane protein PorP/SprF [Aureibaculum flavum]MBJ2176430.1 type IX secretion system membrane protein PorP/SprF [Aureibaculum flavum]
MRKLSSFLLIVLSLVSITGFSQQDPQYTQYMYNMNIVNPAYAGSRGTLSIGLLGRLQWVGIEGAPKTATMAIHAPLGKNLGGGFSAILDEHGPVKETNVYADVSYTINTSEEGRLAFGLKGGITFFDVGLLSLVLPQTAPGVDPLFSDNVNETLPNFGAGVYYYTDKFYVGLSAPNLLETKHLEQDNGTISKASEKMHYFGTVGYVFNLSETLKFKPSVMAKAVTGSPLSLDGSLNFLFNDRLELGASYRFGDSVSGLINFGVTRDLRIGYAYDYTTTNLGNYNSGTHEVFMQWDIDFSKKNLKSPRFF